MNPMTWIGLWGRKKELVIQLEHPKKAKWESLALTCTSSGTPMRAQGVPHRLCIELDDAFT